MNLSEYEIINVDDIDDSDVRPTIKIEPTLEHIDLPKQILQSVQNTETAWISDVCRDVQVKLKSEELVEGKF